MDKENLKRDIDLQKIDILNDYVQAKFNVRGTVWVGGFIGFLILFGTLYFEEVIDFILFAIFTTALLLIFACLVRFVNKPYDDFLVFVDGLHEKMEKGDSLPSITELKRLWRNKLKPS